MNLRRRVPCGLAVLLVVSTANSNVIAQWNPPVPITATEAVEETHIGTAAIDGNDRFHLTWAERPAGGSLQRILFVEGTPGRWGTTREIAPEGENWTPDLAAHPNGSSHLVWVRGMLERTEIWYATNASGVWVSERLTNNAWTDVYPAVAVDGDDLPHVAWAGFSSQHQQGKIFYATKNASGTWVVDRIGRSRL
jgi:hypothetical protein